VGHLQTNKAKQVVSLFDLIHSVDSLKLAEALDAGIRARMGKRELPQKILIQVNISGETSKAGVPPKKLGFVIKEIARYKTMSIMGLMTIPPAFDDPERSRPFFRALRELAVSIGKDKIDDISMKELSMGMSGDFEVAIEEGATLVRIGSAMFGPRS
jgi:pyridoxal phosphate enzyme (YggS family)